MYAITGNTLIDCFIVAAVLMIITFAAKKLLSSIKVKNGRIQTTITILESTIQYVMAIIGLVWILRITGVNVTTIFASVGIVALIVGFSAESLIADVLTGIFMLFENQFNVGDVVEIDGFRGVVDQVGIRTVSIRDVGNNLKIMNNSKINNVINLSSANSKAICDIAVSYGQDLEQVEQKLAAVLSEIYKNNQDVFVEEPVYTGVQELKSSCLMLRIVADVQEENIFQGRRILNRELFLKLKKAGIGLAYGE